MPSSCKDIRAALAECLQNSDCVMVERHTASDCLRPPLVFTLPTRCQQLKKGYGECKRGMVDMRKRFRGNMPVSMMKMDLGEHAKEPSKQLYAGRPAYSTVATSKAEEVEEGKEKEGES